MANFSKIDPVFWSGVHIQSNQEIKCLVWLNDNNSRQLDNVLYDYPFIGAVGLSTKMSYILTLSDMSCVNYISSAKCASVFINKAKKIINMPLPCEYASYSPTIAVIDTGCAPHLDLLLGQNRVVKFVDFVNDRITMYDDNGHGTFVCGVIASNGLCSNGYYSGIVPRAKLVVLKALDNTGETQVFTILNAMQWIMDNKDTYNIRVVCMSFGSEPIEQFDPLVIGAEVLWDNGVVVVSAAGNDGPSIGTIKSPAVSKKIIGVGASRDLGVASFSSRGVYEGITKPDLLAPGVDITSLGIGRDLYTTMSGTSVSAPIVVGVVSIMQSLYPHLSPNEIKARLFNSCYKPPNTHTIDTGAGILDASIALNNDFAN